jgi:ABC-type ATPase with predicted acetyltransferase domain
MGLFEVCKSFEFDGNVSVRGASIMKMFGLDLDDIRDRQPIHQVKFELADGGICFITGPSGGGKSVILRELYEQFGEDEKMMLSDISADREESLIDCFDCELGEAMRLLSKAGISDAFNLLEKPKHLSEGQQYRYRLAQAFATGKKVIFADEFCSTLDRLTAAVVACKTARFARKEGFTLIVASSHDDLLCDMQPDVVVIKRGRGKTEVVVRK